MNKAQRIERARCANSPTGSHRWWMEWADGQYWHHCRDCDEWRLADNTLGYGTGGKQARRQHITLVGSHAEDGK